MNNSIIEVSGTEAVKIFERMENRTPFEKTLLFFKSKYDLDFVFNKENGVYTVYSLHFDNHKAGGLFQLNSNTGEFKQNSFIAGKAFSEIMYELRKCGDVKILDVEN